jgi:Arc/MetJ-type ribon-helix-helix transcriptional regulator
MSNSDGDRSQYERFGPFGAHGSVTAEDALDLLEELLADSSGAASGRSVWDRHDRRAFGSLCELYANWRFIEPAPDVDGAEIGELHRSLTDLSLAVPFSEAERTWLFSRYLQGEQVPDGLYGSTAEVMSAGVRRVIQGRDLARRWWAWRRDEDEFAGQGGLDQARHVLGAIAIQLVRGEDSSPRFRSVLDVLRDSNSSPTDVTER